MKIYTVTIACSTSSRPEVETLFYTDKEKAESDFEAYRNDVGEDYVAITLQMYNSKTDETDTIESFDGNQNDL